MKHVTDSTEKKKTEACKSTEKGRTQKTCRPKEACGTQKTCGTRKICKTQKTGKTKKMCSTKKACAVKKIREKQKMPGISGAAGQKKKNLYERGGKRALDIVCSSAALVVLSPVMAGTALLVYTKLGSPVLFKQDRPGKDEKIFRLYKFRTMTDEKDKDGNFLPDEVRLTKFGKMLRSTSLDELPELFNILKGDMSIVGPRPLLVRYLPRYNERQKKRHCVRPGITGLAQVSGRNAISWQERFELDVKYTENVSFLNDMKILLKTVCTVLAREGINSGTSATMEEFMGN